MAREGVPWEDIAISFDFDGVLARSPFGHGVLFPLLKELARAFAARTGLAAAEAESRARELAWAEFRGRAARGEHVQAYNWQAAVEVASRAMGEAFSGSLTEMTREYADGLRREGDLSPLHPYAQEVLAELWSRGAKLLLLTNGFREYQLPLVRALGLEPYFDAILAADDLGAVKPFPEAFERAFRGCGRSTRYHVGDTLAQDVAGARGSGIFAIWVFWALPDGFTRLRPRDRPRAPGFDDVLRARLEREEDPHGAFAAGHPLDLARPDAVVRSLEEVSGVVEESARRSGRW